MAEHMHLYGETVNCIERYAVAIKNNTENTDHIEIVFNKLREQIDYYCDAKSRTTAVENVLSESLEKVASSDNIKDAKVHCENFDSKVKNINSIKDQSNPWRNILNRLIGDEEIEMVKSSQNVIDPISKKRLVDPVKNTDCGHTYEKSIVLALISKNPKTRCPIPGCNVAQYILKKNLVPDNELKRYLENNADDSINEENSQIVSLDDTC